MRVATYTQSGLAARGSIIAIAILVLTVAMGTSALYRLLTLATANAGSIIALLWLMTYAAALFGLMFNHGINWVSWLSRYRILLVILLLGTTVSASWSLDAGVSAERIVHLLGSSFIAIYLGFMVPLLTTLRVTAIVMAVILLACVGFAFALPSFGLEQYEGTIVWRGILNSKNTLGFWAAVSVLLYITLWDSSNSVLVKLGCLFMAVVALFVLVMSESATSLLAMLMAGALSLYIFIAFRFNLGFIRMVVLAVLFGSLAAFAITSINTAELVGRTGDLTGRGEVWRQTWKLIMAKPLTGYGYGSIWFPNDATIWMQQSLTDFTWIVYHAHNGFLQVASEIGLPLSCIALLMVAQQLIEIFYCQYERQQAGALFVLAFVVAYLISNFSEARFLVSRELYWIFFLALPISMLRQINIMSAEDPVDPPPHPGPVPMGVPGKPWLRPYGNAPAGPALAAQTPISAMQLGHDGQLDFDLSDDSDVTSSMDDTQPKASIALGQLDDLDMSTSGDHTLDTTRSLVDLDLTAEPAEPLEDTSNTTAIDSADVLGDETGAAARSAANDEMSYHAATAVGDTAAISDVDEASAVNSAYAVDKSNEVSEADVEDDAVAVHAVDESAAANDAGFLDEINYAYQNREAPEDEDALLQAELDRTREEASYNEFDLTDDNLADDPYDKTMSGTLDEDFDDDWVERPGVRR